MTKDLTFHGFAFFTIFHLHPLQIHMHSQRYALTHQRLLRHQDFRPKELLQLGSTEESIQYRLTPIESLLGRQKHRHEKSILLLGLLTQVEEGQYYLEDLTGQVPISFQHAIVMEGFFITEGNILLVEGVFQDGILHALRIGHPMLEERPKSLAIIQQQVRHPAFSNLALPLSDSPVVVLSDVHLDQPRVLQQLDSLFCKFEASKIHHEPLFCLMGNFCSQFHLHSGEAVHQALEELAHLIARFPNLSQRAHFCLVPGPNDGVGHCLPYSWPKSLSTMPCWNKIKKVQLTSNPAKIFWNGTAMTIFRHNVLSLMQQQQIPLPVDKEAGEIVKVPHLRLIKTLLDQGHLLPLSGAPIYWNYDHALRLYPLPETLILGSSDSDAFYEVYGGVDVLHPGSFAKQGEFARHFPGVIEDEVQGDFRVSLDQVDENWNK
jgi:DNA polymerase epsilon subunit 2